MAREYLKKAHLTATSDATNVRDTVQGILDDIEAGGDRTALDYAAKFDKYDGDILMSEAAIEAACAQVPDRIKRDIQFSHDNVRRFAEAQKRTLNDIEVEVVPGLIAGQKAIPVDSAGCYIPGGRYSHIASAIMTVTTAKVAGCRHIVACSPPRPGVGVPPAIVYAAHICGADKIMAMGDELSMGAMASLNSLYAEGPQGSRPSTRTPWRTSTRSRRPPRTRPRRARRRSPGPGRARRRRARGPASFSRECARRGPRRCCSRAARATWARSSCGL